MSKIKTKETVKGTIKQLDRAAAASERMKRAYIQTKEKAENSAYTFDENPEQYAADRMEIGVQSVSLETAHRVQQRGKTSVFNAKGNIQGAKKAVQEFRKIRAEQKEKRTQESLDPRPEPTTDAETLPPRTTEEKLPSPKVERGDTVDSQTAPQRSQNIKTREQPVSQAKETAKAAEKKSVKTAQQSVKTAERTSKTTIKTSEEAAKIAEKSARESTKALQKVKAKAKALTKKIKSAAKVTAAAIKAIVAGARAAITAIVAGVSVAVTVVVLICVVALLAGSVFGIFFSSENSDSEKTMRHVVQKINAEYDTRLEAEKASASYDVLEMSGSRAVWKEVLSVYAVKVNTDPNDPQEVATIDDAKKQLLSDIFWEMNDISSHSETADVTVTEETDDGNGNIVTTETTKTVTTLYITVTHKTADEMALQYGFSQEQKDYLAELLADENNQLWSAVLYGIGYGDDQIVTVALSQIGNVGGEPYWSWYGFSSQVEWCACFVSWCANECGYIDSGIIPKFASCAVGVQWFKDRGQWADNSVEPVAGMIIFFDWDTDGAPDHVGIVEKVEDGTVYTIEGNSSNSVKIKSYPVGYYEILGYGVVMY